MGRENTTVSNLSKSLSGILRKIRIDHSDSQAKASEKLDISKAFVSELESGKRNITLSVLEKYSKAYNVNVFLLIFLAENKWRHMNSSKYLSYKELKEKDFVSRKKQHNEYLRSELEKLIE